MCSKLLFCCIRNQKDDFDETFADVLPESDIEMKLWSCCNCCRKESASLRNYRVRRLAEVESVIGRESGLQIFEMNNFVLEKQLGRGTDSEVRLLVQKRSKRKFAGKVLQSGTSWSLLNEASLMRNFSEQCANIAHVEGIIVNPKVLVLRYYKNGDLGTALMRDNNKMIHGSASEFPFLLRLNYIQDTCKAVTFLHKANVCHRDLSMRNLLLSDDKQHVLLTDFTLSRAVEGTLKTQSTLTAEIPVFSPPEAFARNHLEVFNPGGLGRFYSLKSDIWGLGITMFEIIEKKTFVQPMRGQYKLPTRLPKNRLPPKHVFDKGQILWCEILRCWSYEPEKRPWSWEVLDEITKMVNNPRGRNANDGYFHRFSTRTATTARVSTSKFLPPTWSGKDLLIETTSVWDFCETLTSETGALTESVSTFGDGNSSFNIKRSITTPLKIRMPNPLGMTKSVTNRHLLTVSNRGPQLKVKTNLSLVSTRTNSINSSLMSTSSHPEFNNSSPNLDYCDPLSFTPSDDPSVTNIAYSNGRKFFDAAAMKMINQPEIVVPECCIDGFSETEEPELPKNPENGTEMAPSISSESTTESQLPIVKIVSSSNRTFSGEKALTLQEVAAGWRNSRSDSSSSLQESILENSDVKPEKSEYLEKMAELNSTRILVN